MTFQLDRTGLQLEQVLDNGDNSNAGKESLGDVADLNAISGSGFFRTGNVTSNNFPSIFCGAYQVQRSATEKTQIGISTNSANAYFRSSSSGVFGATFELIHSGNADSMPITTSLSPDTDNLKTLGKAAGRYSEIFSGNDTINTSDAREKTSVSTLTADELNASNDLVSEIGTYKFLSAIDLKGDGARTHIGLTVQKSIEIMESNNLDPFAYSFICYDEWPEETDQSGNVTQEAGNRYGLRYSQLNQFLIAGLASKFSAIESRLDALEGV